MLEYSGPAAASAVIMSHKLRVQKIIFVEGVQEGLLLECLFDNQVNTVSANGYLGVVEAVDTINKFNSINPKNKVSIIGFIDKDYLQLRDDQGILKRSDIVTTTHRDIEIDILNSNAAKRFLEEKANSSKWDCERKVVEGILQNLHDLSYLRAYNHVFDKKWDFKWIDLIKYSDNDGEINYEKLISAFRQKNHIANADWSSFATWLGKETLCLNSITRGHDATCLFGKMLRNKLGNRKKDETHLTVVEENLRLSVEAKFINIYQWFKLIYEWAYNKSINLTLMLPVDVSC